VERPFYDKGLAFGCTRCSKCCTGEPGYVFLSKTDLSRLLDHFSLAFRVFYREYCRLVNVGEGFAISLRERSDHACIFWGNEGCSVYEARPIQCSTYPFWSSILSTSEAWEEEAKDCPGIGGGSLHGREEIENALYARRAAGTIIIDPEIAKRPELMDEDTVLGR
jgi:Fe-S-cluster containining protein